CHREPRHTHPFPTRRSSDLGKAHTYHSARHVARHHGACADYSVSADGHAGMDEDIGADPTTLLQANRRADQREILTLIIVSGRRSEEHTSELQSRENLVCRL